MSTKTIKAGLSKDNVNAIAGAIGTATLNRLVPQFSTGVAYTKGQYTNYNNQLYRFTADKSAGAWDSTKVESASLNDLIDDVNGAVASVTGKADIVDLENGTLVVAHAEEADSLTTKTGKLDKTPFAFESSGGQTDIETGYQKTLKLVGCNLVDNNHANNGKSSFSDHDVTFIKNNDGTWTINGTATADIYQSLNNVNINLISGHKYLFENPLDNNDATRGLFYIDATNGAVDNIDLRVSKIITANMTTTCQIKLRINSGAVFDNYKINPNIFTDLYQLFGSAEVCNAIIGNDSSTQVTKLMQFLGGKLPTTYNAGSFSATKSKYIKSVEYNLFQALDTNIRVLPSTNYRVAYWNGSALAPITSGSVKEYDQAGNLIKTTTYDNLVGIKSDLDNAYQNATDKGFKTTLQTCYVQLSGVSNSNILFNQAWDGTRDTFDTYKEHIDELPNIQLNGILKVDGNGNVYADGDELYPDGVGNARRYAIIDLGSLSWGTPNANGWVSSTASTDFHAKPANDNNSKPNAICTKYEVTSPAIAYQNDGKCSITGSATPNAYCVTIRSSALIGLTSAQTKTALTGVYLIYELLPSYYTDIIASNFNPNLYADDFGTLQFLDEDSNEVSGLQGNEIFYKANIAGFAESLYIRTEGEPSDVVKQSELSAVSSRIPPLPSDSEDGTYTLKATMSSGTITYDWVADE